jgi:hypothetical protein
MKSAKKTETKKPTKKITDANTCPRCTEEIGYDEMWAVIGIVTEEDRKEAVSTIAILQEALELTDATIELIINAAAVIYKYQLQNGE